MKSKSRNVNNYVAATLRFWRLIHQLAVEKEGKSQDIQVLRDQIALARVEMEIAHLKLTGSQLTEARAILAFKKNEFPQH